MLSIPGEACEETYTNLIINRIIATFTIRDNQIEYEKQNCCSGYRRYYIIGCGFLYSGPFLERQSFIH